MVAGCRSCQWGEIGVKGAGPLQRTVKEEVDLEEDCGRPWASGFRDGSGDAKRDTIATIRTGEAEGGEWYCADGRGASGAGPF